jgi:hypothetical protein
MHIQRWNDYRSQQIGVVHIGVFHGRTCKVYRSLCGCLNIDTLGSQFHMSDSSVTCKHCLRLLRL